MSATELEPARFGITGCGAYVGDVVREELQAEARAYALDAPSHIPRGSLAAGHLQHDGTRYISATDAREATQ